MNIEKYDEEWFISLSGKDTQMKLVRGKIENTALNDVMKYKQNKRNLNLILMEIKNLLNTNNQILGSDYIIYLDWQEMYVSHLLSKYNTPFYSNSRVMRNEI